MSIFNEISSRIHYYFDIIKVNPVAVKIERFSFHKTEDVITVIYRLGRKKLLNTMPINTFEKEFFDRLYTFDRYRIIKFSILQNIMDNLFKRRKFPAREDALNFIKKEIKNEQLF
ncbi:MAG: hypothetical protein V3V61_00585 [Gammaproteobacteria bacterium]